MASLSSDHVNYLIWRYLQEQGYGKAAVQLSRDWHNDDPQSLPFADQVRHHSLIQMLQDALAYDQLAADARKTQDRATEGDAQHLSQLNRDELGRRWGFVDVTKRRPVDKASELRRGPTAENADNRRKRQRRETVDGQRPPLGRRKSLKPVDQEEDSSRDAMDVDFQATERASEQPEPENEEPAVEEPPPPIPPTLEIGQSIGMQSDKTTEEPVVKTIASHEIPDAEIYRVAWDDQEPDRLMVSGGSVCHSLRIQKQPTDSHQQTLPNGDVPSAASEYHIISERSLQKANDVIKYSVAQWERQPSGCHVAFAIEELYESGDVRGSVKIVGNDTDSRLADTPNVVVALKWSPNSQRILTCWNSSEEDSTCLTIWNVDDVEPSTELRSGSLICDVTWLDDERIACCGDKILNTYQISGSTFNIELTLETHHVWEQIKYDQASSNVVCMMGGEGILGLVNIKEGELRTKVAHEDVVTHLQWEPPTRSNEDDPTWITERPRILATSCTDGSLKLWKAQSALECVHTFSFGPIMPVWTMAFTLDGQRLAAVTGEQVQVWEVEADSRSPAKWTEPDKIKLIARWAEPSRTDHPGDENAMQLGDTSTDDNARDAVLNDEHEGSTSVHSLAWDAGGQRLVLTRGNKIYVTEIPAKKVDDDIQMT